MKKLENVQSARQKVLFFFRFLCLLFHWPVSFFQAFLAWGRADGAQLQLGDAIHSLALLDKQLSEAHLFCASQLQDTYISNLQLVMQTKKKYDELEKQIQELQGRQRRNPNLVGIDQQIQRLCRERDGMRDDTLIYANASARTLQNSLYRELE